MGSQKKMEPKEESLAQQLYNEIMVRYIVGYPILSMKTFTEPDSQNFYATKNSQEASSLAGSLALFENRQSMRLILQRYYKHQSFKILDRI